MPTLCSARLPRLAFIITALLPVTGATTTCYYPNGSPVGNDEYTPCRNNTGYTMCCRTGGLVPDTCDENGLCYNICDQMGSGCHNNPGTFWRESCTDQSWQSPYCLQNLCTDKSVSFCFYIDAKISSSLAGILLTVCRRTVQLATTSP